MTTQAWIQAFENDSDEQLITYARTQRWFRSKSNKITGFKIDDILVHRLAQSVYVILWVTFCFKKSTAETYFLPLVGEPNVLKADKHESLLNFTIAGKSYQFKNAFDDKPFEEWFLRRFFSGDAFKTQFGKVTSEVARTAVALKADESLVLRNLNVEQSNTSMVLNERLMIKVYRKLEGLVNPEAEMLQFLTEHEYPNAPKLHSAVSYKNADNEVSSLALMVDYVRCSSDGWKAALERLKTVFASMKLQKLTPFLEALKMLGIQTRQMHETLASDAKNVSFAPEQVSIQDVENWKAQYCALFDQVMQSPKTQALKAFSEGTGAAVQEVTRLVEKLYEDKIYKIRHHGDFHLGQVLQGDAGWILVDFEGEPLRSLKERQGKACALKDVAGMLRSLSYAAHVAARDFASLEVLRDMAEEQMRRAFLSGYFNDPSANETLFLFSEVADNYRCLRFFELEKAVYELNYEINNRPDWVDVPLRGIQKILNR